jgi:hypothetical protein
MIAGWILTGRLRRVGVRLLWAALMVQDHVRRLLIRVRGMFDQRLLCQLESLALAAAGLDHSPFGRIEILIAGVATDMPRFLCRSVDLFLLKAPILGHREFSFVCCLAVSSPGAWPAVKLFGAIPRNKARKRA